MVHTLYVIQRNDLETSEIAKLVTKAKQPHDGVCIVDRPWGHGILLDELGPSLKSCSTVCLIEINDPSLEAALAREGKAVELIDHKEYASPNTGQINRRHGLTALEQLFQKFRQQGPSADFVKNGWRRTELVAAREMGGMPHLTRTYLQHQQARAGLEPIKWPAPHLRWQKADLAGNSARTATAHLVHASVEPRAWRAGSYQPTKPSEGLIPVSAVGSAPETIPGGELGKALDAIRAIRNEDLAITWQITAADPEKCNQAPAPAPSGSNMQAAVQKILDDLANHIDHALAGAAPAETAFAPIFAQEHKARASHDADHDILLIIAPLNSRLFLTDAIYEYYSRQGQPFTMERNILALYYESDPDGPPLPETPADCEGRLTRLEYCGQASNKTLFDHALNPAMRVAMGLERLSAYLVGEADVAFGLYNGNDVADGPFLISRFCDFLLQNLLLGARPVAAWRTHMIQPLWLTPPHDKGKNSDETLETLIKATQKKLKQAAESTGTVGETSALALQKVEDTTYFMRHLRKQIALQPKDFLQEPSGDAYLCSLEIPVLQESKPLVYQITVPHYPEPFDCPLLHLRLHLFHNDTLCLEWVIGSPPLSKTPEVEDEDKQTPTFWQSLLTDTTGPSLARVADLNNAARNVYSGFKCNEQEWRHGAWSQIRLLAGDDMLASLLFGADAPGARDAAPRLVLKALLQHALSHISADPDAVIARLQLIGDFRARIATSVVCIGDRPSLPGAESRLDATLDRLREVDRFDTSFAYSPKFSEDLLNRNRLRRHEIWGSHFVASDHAFAYLGFAGTKPKKSYALEEIHQKHMAHPYLRMALLAQLYTAVMHVYSCKISEALGHWRAAEGARLPDQYNSLLPGLLKFVNLLWFNQVSSHVQGVELFDLIRNPTSARDDYAMIRDHIERTQEYWERVSERRSESRIRTLALVGIPTAVFGGTLGLFDRQDVAPFWSFLNNLGLGRPGDFVALAAGITLMVSLLVLALLLPARRRTLPAWARGLVRGQEWLVDRLPAWLPALAAILLAAAGLAFFGGVLVQWILS